jgi:ankyrin repeat protein
MTTSTTNTSTNSASNANANLETLEYLLKLKKEENIPIQQIVDQDGNTLLHKAIMYNQFDAVRHLIKHHGVLLNIKNYYGIYPIHLSIIKSNMQIVRLVTRNSKKHINTRDYTGLTAVMHAAVDGKYEALKYLIDNANAKHNKLTKKERYTLLHLSVQSGSIDIVQYLLMKMGPSYLKSRTKDGATVYHLAAARGHDQILEYLLAIKAAKYVKHIKDIYGSTPAHDAAENGTQLLNSFNFLVIK